MNKEILSKLKILYVEDEDEVREFTGKTIQTIVEKIVIAENGEDGLNKFKENQDIDLIITDINMPKMSGLEMCEKIKEISPEIPIVVTTAHNDASFLKKAIDVGVSSYAMKPIDLYKLITNIVKAVEPIFLKRELRELNLALESKIKEGIKKVRSILDAQDNIVILSNGQQIINANKRFLEFFNQPTLEDYLEKANCIAEYFVEEEGFFYTKLIGKDECWLKHMSEKLKEIDRVVKIKNAQGESRIFTVNIDNYENKGEYFVISLTDITELKEKANLLEYQANHDTLTGLYNRHKFHTLFAIESKRDRRYNNSLSLIIFDIDNFKDINDLFGHAMGDTVLQEVANIVSQNVREHDTVIRWGGEEFIILLPETNLDGAVKVAQKLQAVLENAESKRLPQKITASFGVASLNEDDNESTILQRADKGLYQAKQNGKNQVAFI